MSVIDTIKMQNWVVNVRSFSIWRAYENNKKNKKGFNLWY